MPLFEYHCTGCDTRFERLVRLPARVDCPSCGSTRVEKLLSVPARPASREAPAASACETAPPGGCCGGGMCQLN